MPFITEEIWGHLGKSGRLIRDVWPLPLGFASAVAFAEAAKRVEVTKEIVRAVRNIRAEAGASPARKFPVLIKNDAGTDVSGIATDAIMNLAGVSEVRVTTDEGDIPEESVSAILTGMTVFVPLAELVDFAAEREKLAKEQERLQGETARLSGKLAKEGFLAKAPETIVRAEREKLAAAEEALAKILVRIAQIERK
jgi:valyl-tRNA synthetase